MDNSLVLFFFSPLENPKQKKIKKTDKNKFLKRKNLYTVIARFIRFSIFKISTKVFIGCCRSCSSDKITAEFCPVSYNDKLEVFDIGESEFDVDKVFMVGESTVPSSKCEPVTDNGDFI